MHILCFQPSKSSNSSALQQMKNQKKCIINVKELFDGRSINILEPTEIESACILKKIYKNTETTNELSYIHQS